MWFICPNPCFDFQEKLDVLSQLAAKNYGDKLHGIVAFIGLKKELFIALITEKDILETMKRTSLNALAKREEERKKGVDPQLIIPDDPLLYLYKIDHDHDMLGEYRKEWDFADKVTITFIYPSNLVLPDIWNNIPINFSNSNKITTRLNGSIESWFLLHPSQGDFRKEIDSYCKLAEKRYAPYFRAAVVFENKNKEYYLAQFLTSGGQSAVLSSMRDAMNFEKLLQGKSLDSTASEDPLCMLRQIDPEFNVLGLRHDEWTLPEDVSIFFLYPENLILPEEWPSTPRDISNIN